MKRISISMMITSVVMLGGCSAMQGVNVGASIPIGGIGGVGVNKTIGSGKDPATPRGRQDQPETSPSEEEEDSEEP